jgi:hypothetical protein
MRPPAWTLEQGLSRKERRSGEPERKVLPALGSDMQVEVNGVSAESVVPNRVSTHDQARNARDFKGRHNFGEPNVGVRELAESLASFHRLDVTTAYPFLLRCYDELEAGRLSPDEFARVIQALENHVVRRFVCSIPTNQFNKVFPGLYNQVRREAHPSILAGVRAILAGRGYPKDVEFRKALSENSLYGSGDRQAKIRFILERIERHLAGKEPPKLETVSVEHVMPQALTEEWRTHLGDDWETAHALWLHTLGNLMLTGYNSEMSNDNFLSKRQRLTGGTLHLNKLFASFDSWRVADIMARAEIVVEPVLSIWPYFGGEQPDELIAKPRGQRPAELRIFGKSVAVTT